MAPKIRLFILTKMAPNFLRISTSGHSINILVDSYHSVSFTYYSFGGVIWANYRNGRRLVESIY